MDSHTVVPAVWLTRAPCNTGKKPVLRDTAYYIASSHMSRKRSRRPVSHEASTGSPCDETQKRLRDLPPPPSAIACASLDDACASFVEGDCTAALVRRPLSSPSKRLFRAYMGSDLEAGAWKLEAEAVDPREATLDRCVLLELPGANGGSGGMSNGGGISGGGGGGEGGDDLISRARGYGRGLPAAALGGATGEEALSELLRVLPESCISLVGGDACDLVGALWRHTGCCSFRVSLEIVRADTCQRWHMDHNISRSIVTYVGPTSI